MGSGSRLKFFRNRGGLWLGFAIDNMPFHWTLAFGLGWHVFEIGLGKAYDEYESEGKF